MDLCPRPVRWILLALGAWLVAFEVAAILPSHPGQASIFADGPSDAVQLAAALLCAERARRMSGRERAAWGLIASAIVAWTLGDVYWITALSAADLPPVPSLADAGYLIFYPCTFAGIVLLMKARVAEVPRTLAVDGLTAALAAGAVSAAAVLPPVAKHAEGGTLAIATNLAYPVTDLVLLGLIVVAIARRCWRLDRTWALLGAGTIAFWVADSLYLVMSANGSYVTPSLFDVGWPGSTVLIAAAAWQPVVVERSGERHRGWREVLFPVGLASVALIVTMLQRPSGAHVPALVLAISCVAGVMGRLVMTFRENVAMLDASRREALTDDLTGLGNRRALMADLEHGLSAADRGGTLVLVLFDLDGFKHYNDSFGHPAGDALLARMGASLARAVSAYGRAYRMGGDEFCVLVKPGREPAGPILAALATSLRQEGDSFSIGCSYGAVLLPQEAVAAADALRLADQRMYAAKRGSRAAAGRQSADVLLQALAERDPDLGCHHDDVAALAEAVARRLALPPEDVEQVRQAAELHDIGKVAIPDAILNKPGPLDAREWEFIRDHTLTGERIISAAPALSRVAALVRSTHERFDGGGYPDSLEGAAIPLGARIVAVCDAFDAMVTDRSYRAALSTETAIAELRRCAGTQFDPVVVEAFCTVWAEVLRERGALRC